MLQIKAKIYYDVTDGNVLVVTSECEGDATETTKEQDLQAYEQLKNKNIDEVDFIELEYGTLATTFTNAKSYKVNINTKQLDITYYTEDELKAMQNKLQNYQELRSRVSDIAQYLANNENSISDVEDLILQSEQNKIINGGI